MDIGFKKEHLKVHLDHYGNLRTSGERPVNGNRWRRFRKEFRIPDDCNPSEIRAKFENGILTLTLPKLISEEPAQVAAPPPAQVPEPQAMPKPSEREPEPEPAKTENGKDKEKVEEEMRREQEKGKYGVGRLMIGMKMKRRQFMITFAVVAVIVVGCGIYVAYKFRKMAGPNSIGSAARVN